ncbi:CACNA1C [Symbiodinium sp. CCMP2456]|nr:CACNA1C [Symbiodinium sp. CCMP2456]
MPRHRQERHSDDNESIDSGEDDGFPNIGDMATDFERAVSTGSAISFSRRGEIIEIPSEADEHSTARKLAISAGYFQRAGSDSNDVSIVERGRSNLSVHRAYGWAKKLVRSQYFAHFMVVVVLLDAVLTASDIDARAAGVDTPSAVLAGSSVCLALYTVELLLQLAVRGPRIFKDWLTRLDVFIIGSGYADVFLGMLLHADVLNSIGIVRVLRLSRIVRLMQLMRKNRSLRELRKLVTMLATCFKTLLWSFLFLSLVMTGWAMLIVELINPYVLQMQASHPFDNCEECKRSTTSVMHANLMLFKTVIAGDSWGLIAVPMIESHPETAIIFVGASLTLVFGVLNLIVAVVVDTFAETRENDVVNLAQEMEFSMEDDQQILKQIFRRIDTNNDGELTLEELLNGARTDAEFQSRLRVMDIDEVDLQQFFDMIDLDGSGSIEADEFVVPLSRWVHDSKTAPRFIKYNLMRAMAQQEELLKYSHQHFAAISENLQEIRCELRKGRRPFAAAKPRRSSDPPVVKRVSFDSESSQVSIASGVPLEPKAKDTFPERAAGIMSDPNHSVFHRKLDKLKADLELSLQVAMGQLDACFHEASLGLQSMAPTHTSPVHGEDGSPRRSLVRNSQADGALDAMPNPASDLERGKVKDAMPSKLSKKATRGTEESELVSGDLPPAGIHIRTMEV